MLTLLAITVGFLMWGISTAEQRQLQAKKIKVIAKNPDENQQK